MTTTSEAVVDDSTPPLFSSPSSSPSSSSPSSPSSSSLSSSSPPSSSSSSSSSSLPQAEEAPLRRLSTPRQETINVMRRCLRSSHLLAAPESGAGEEQLVHSVLGLLYYHLDALYETGIVPEVSEFERFLAILISEVADNTYAGGGMAPYAEKKLVDGVEQKAPFIKSAQGNRGTVRFTLLNSGLRAFERCALQYLESGGGHLGKLPSRRRRALDGVLRDFDFFDPLREARGLPSATVAGLGFLHDATPRFCSLFEYPSAKRPSVSVAMDVVKAHFDKIISLARQLGAHLAKLQPTLPKQEGVSEGITLAANLNCADAASPGLMQNLNAARRFLQPRRNEGSGSGTLARFLDYALELAQRRTYQVCVGLVGAAQGAKHCDPRTPSAQCQHRADVAALPGVRKSELQGFHSPSPPNYAAVEDYMLPAALRRRTETGTAASASETAASSASESESESALASASGSASESESESASASASGSASESESGSASASTAPVTPKIPSAAPAAVAAPTALAAEALRRGIPRHLLPL